MINGESAGILRKRLFKVEDQRDCLLAKLRGSEAECVVLKQTNMELRQQIDKLLELLEEK